MNKYVNFVSDDVFLNCVRKVVEAYKSRDFKPPIELLKNSKNTNDEFKTIFDIYVNKLSLNKWSRKEIERQYDKTINNKIGEFHQELLGHVEGWVDLGIGDKTEIDLKKEDNSIFIELKNKHNTMNSSSSKTCREKLENIIEEYPNSRAYWAYIISKNYISEDCVWKYKDHIYDERIRRISGDKLYELITGESDSLEKTLYAIPRAICDILGEDHQLSKTDQSILKEYLQDIFNSK